MGSANHDDGPFHQLVDGEIDLPTQVTVIILRIEQNSVCCLLKVKVLKLFFRIENEKLEMKLKLVMIHSYPSLFSFFLTSQLLSLKD